jgi:hypothetical protein
VNRRRRWQRESSRCLWAMPLPQTADRGLSNHRYRSSTREVCANPCCGWSLDLGSWILELYRWPRLVPARPGRNQARSAFAHGVAGDLL